MNIIVVEDERIILKMEETMIKNLLPEASVEAFSYADEAFEYAEHNTVDLAFLDINLEANSGVVLAKKLQSIYPKINIIFCTGYSEYALEALDMYCSAYLMKPITEEKIKNALSKLRYPVSNKVSGLFVKCFGIFEVLYKGIPVKFKYAKTKQLFAYLIDRNGEVLGIRDIMAVICEEDGKESYIRNIKADLINTFRLLGIEKVLIQDRGKIGINKELISCDYYDYLEGNKDIFNGEYMNQYSFGEITLAGLK